MMDYTVPAEPTDLFLKGIQTTNEFLRQDYEKILSLVKLHEQELVLLWLAFFASLAYQTYHGRRTNKILRELLNNGT